MTRRHLLTLFALFTGLAALQSPAQASALDNMVFDASALTKVSDTAHSENSQCQIARSACARRWIARQPRIRTWPAPAVMHAPVIIGPDRALE